MVDRLRQDIGDKSGPQARRERQHRERQIPPVHVCVAPAPPRQIECICGHRRLSHIAPHRNASLRLPSPILQYIMQRWRNHDLSRAFEKWMEVAEERFLRALKLQFALRRWMEPDLSRAFNAWMAALEQSRRTRVVSQHIMQRWMNHDLSRAFNQWVAVVDEAKAAAAAEKKADASESEDEAWVSERAAAAPRRPAADSSDSDVDLAKLRRPAPAPTVEVAQSPARPAAAPPHTPPPQQPPPLAPPPGKAVDPKRKAYLDNAGIQGILEKGLLELLTASPRPEDPHEFLAEFFLRERAALQQQQGRR